MEDSQIFTGKTVEEAVEEGLKILNADREDVEIEVLNEGKVRKLGKSTPAEVKITVKEKLSDGVRAATFLEGLFDKLGESVQAQLKSEDEKIIIELKAGDGKFAVGRRGEVIDAVQTLAGAVANKGRKDYRRVVVDYDNYREHREETLKRVAEKLAAKAVRTGKRVRLEPMTPYERRIIHAALMENKEVSTHSEGREPARYVVITPNHSRGGNFRGGKGGGRDKHGDRGYGEKKGYPDRKLPKESTPQSSGTSFTRSSDGYKLSGFFGTFLGNSRDDEE